MLAGELEYGDIVAYRNVEVPASSHDDPRPILAEGRTVEAPGFRGALHFQHDVDGGITRLAGEVDRSGS